MIQFDFQQKTVLITGASRGIGRETARQFAAAGARVLLHYHQNRAAAEETSHLLPGSGHLMAQADLSRTEEIARLVEGLLAQAGRIDILINNAAIFADHSLPQVTFDAWHDAWRRTLGTNLFGPADLCYLVGRHMIERGGGRIVNVSSRGAFRGEPDAPAYGASKAGLNAMGQSLARSLAPHNVFVHTVAPGFVETDMAAGILSGPLGDEIRRQSPLNRVARPDEVARTILFLAAEGTEFLTGCIVDLNGASYLRS